MIGRFIKLPKYSVFEYKPRFYNPEEEERKARRQSALREAGITDGDNYTPHIKGQFRRKFSRMSKNSKARRMSNIRVFIILTVLFILMYYMMVDNSLLMSIFSK